MRRDEALKKAVDAIAQFDQERRDRWKTPAHFPNIPVGGAPIGAVQDWAAPTVHQVIVALEAIGVVKFDEEPACPFKLGDPVRFICGGKSQGRVEIVLNRWNVRTSNGNYHAVNTLELDVPPRGRTVHRVPVIGDNFPSDGTASIYEDTLVETLQMIGYAVVRKEKPPKLPETAYMLCGCAESEFCPQGGVGPRQRCKIPISRNKRWVLERALRVLNGEN